MASKVYLESMVIHLLCSLFSFDFLLHSYIRAFNSLICVIGCCSLLKSYIDKYLLTFSSSIGFYCILQILVHWQSYYIFVFHIETKTSYKELTVFKIRETDHMWKRNCYLPLNDKKKVILVYVTPLGKIESTKMKWKFVHSRSRCTSDE